MHVTYREFGGRDYAFVAGLMGLRRPDAAISADELRREDETLPPPCKFGRIVAVHDGRVVGFAGYDQNPGMYHPTTFHLDVVVEPGHRGRGIGARLYDGIREALEPKGPTKLLARLGGDDARSLGFAAKRGFVEHKRDVASHIDLKSFDPDAHAATVERAVASGIDLVPLSDVIDDDAKVRAYYQQFCAVRADVPRSMPATPVSFDLFVQEVIRSPEVLAECTYLAFAGATCVGLTQLYRSEASASVATGLTGVDRAYRGRGLATALKALSLAAAKRAGGTSAHTDNDVRNAGMLAVNARLGFVRQPDLVTMRLDLPVAANGAEAGDRPAL